MKARRIDVTFIAIMALIAGLLLSGGAVVFVIALSLKLSAMLKAGSFIACFIGFLAACLVDSEINRYFPIPEKEVKDGN